MDKFIKLSMLPIILTSIVIDKIDTGFIFPKCIIKLFLGLECWGCGMTTAILELFKFNWVRAYEINSLAPIVVMLISVIFVKEIFNMVKKNG
jgi:hypothetical protein